MFRVADRNAREISKEKGKVIVSPHLNSIEEVGRGFGRLSHQAFDKAVGATDGCHIRIKPPKHKQADYFDHKLIHSIQLQAICNSSGKFMNHFLLIKLTCAL